MNGDYLVNMKEGKLIGFSAKKEAKRSKDQGLEMGKGTLMRRIGPQWGGTNGGGSDLDVAERTVT